MENALDVLKERGFVYELTDEAGLRAALEQPITFYAGFDPTAASLTAGHLVPLMAMLHLQRHGHRPIAVVGGGTALVGDPTGKTKQRPILTLEEIQTHMESQRHQLARVMDFSEDRALMLNNADWLLPVRYLDFLRDIGPHFTVRHMLAAETYRTRLDVGLSFLEFSYMLLQACDFLHLFRAYGCVLQIGGSDQWANCLAGADLIRRVDRREAFVLVTPLLTTASGAKMGKTEAGRVWLDPEQTTPYEFYQFWMNTEDPDVERFLGLFTLLPMDEVRKLGRREGADLRESKETLAFHATSLVHGEAAARDAQAAARALFGGPEGDDAGVPTTDVAAAALEAGLSMVQLLVDTGLAASRNEARRLIQQGGVLVAGCKAADVDALVDASAVSDGQILLRVGKKRFHRVRVI